MKDTPCFEFPVTIYNILEQITPTLSKARVRIFYKGANRNGSYITDEFAEKLISTLPYAPVKGIYDVGQGDYTDHGPDNNYGRIYGVVPVDNNFAWETNVDEDGVARTYATCDVYLYTAMYKEAGEIVGKSQSMELYPPSISGEWIVYQGSRYFRFIDGAFFGLQVLGDAVEPCFEGASFFTVQSAEEGIKQLTKIIDQLNAYVLKYSYGGKSKMELNFKVSDREKFDAIWTLLNTKYNEESGWEISYSILDVYDDYALVYDYENKCYGRVAYTKNDEADTVELGEFTVRYIMDLSAEEKTLVDSLRIAAGSFELLSEAYEAGQKAIEDLKARDKEINEYSTKISELESNISTLNTEKETSENNFAELSGRFSVLEEEVEDLRAYKAKSEKEKKLAVIKSYESVLNEDVIEDFVNKVDEYADVISLDKDLAYALKNSNFSIFTQTPEFIPVESGSQGDLRELLTQYKK